MFQVIFRGAHVVDPLNGRNGVFDVAVQDGKIAEEAPQITGKAETEYDFSGKVLQPGIIDSHVHLGSMWGSFYGHRMLARSGVTTCLDMAGRSGRRQSLALGLGAESGLEGKRNVQGTGAVPSFFIAIYQSLRRSPAARKPSGQ